MDAIAAFDWQLLRVFDAIVCGGSMSAAAERLGSSQPTVSRQLGELESRLGMSLFERSRRGLRLTAAGQALVAPVASMREQVHAIGRIALAADPRARVGVVRITASEMMSVRVLPVLIGRLLQQHPGLEIELLATNAVANLLEREADIALRMVAPQQGALIARKLGELPIGLWCSEAYREKHGSLTSMTDVAHHTLIGYDADPVMLRGFNDAGIPIGQGAFRFRSDSHVAGWEAVKAGVGIGIFADVFMQGLPELVRLWSGPPLPRLPLWLTAHRELRDSARIRLVFDFLKTSLLHLLDE